MDDFGRPKTHRSPRLTSAAPGHGASPRACPRACHSPGVLMSDIGRRNGPVGDHRETHGGEWSIYLDPQVMTGKNPDESGQNVLRCGVTAFCRKRYGTIYRQRQQSSPEVPKSTQSPAQTWFICCYMKQMENCMCHITHHNHGYRKIEAQKQKGSSLKS